MKSPRTLFVCQECGAQAQKWLGRCPECGAWNTFVEEPVAPDRPDEGRRYGLPTLAAEARLYADIDLAAEKFAQVGRDLSVI